MVLPQVIDVQGSLGAVSPKTGQIFDDDRIDQSGIAEKIPIPVSFQMFTSSLVYQGGLPPVFRRIFALCPAFRRRVGYLPYPREKSGTQGRQRLLLFFTVVVCSVLDVYFQLQTRISQVPQRLLVFASVPQKKQNSIVVTLPGQLCDG